MKKVLFAVLAAFLAGCATSPEITAWNMAREVNTPAAYHNFTQRYPDSGHAEEARERIGKSKLEQIMKSETVGQCILAMKGNPDPAIAAAVGDLACNAARKETSAEALYDFLTYFKGHAGAPEIRLRLEELEFKAAKEDASPAALEYFLLRFPESRFSAEASTLLEEKSYGQVKGWGNRFGYLAFLQRYPDSPRAAEIRSLAGNAPPQAAAPNARDTLARAADKSPALKRYGCALALSAEIRKKPADAAERRRAIFDLEKGTGSGDLPAVCAPVKLVARPGAGEGLDEAFRLMERAEERRNSLASYWKAYNQRDELARTAGTASARVADELEAAELSEDVLGSGPLGGLDVGAERASVSARKAVERFQAAGKSIERDRADIKRLLVETDALYKPLQYFLAGSIAPEPVSGGAR